MAKLELGTLGEFGLIEALRRRARRAGGPWVEGIGDDAAVLRPRPGHEIALTSDALIEDVHFRWATTDARSLGAKTLAVSLSDLGAMGARPLGCLLSLGLPADATGERIDGFLRGLLGTARAARCPLVGGDTVRARAWMLSLTAVGELPRGQALWRRGARPGDRILVTGALGGAALGLALLERGEGGAPSAGPFVRRQLRPAPPWQAGERLRRSGLATAAIDLSDGLVQDLGHVLRASRVGADLELERLPLPRGMGAACQRAGLDPERLALAGGEDYELLFCVRPRAPAAQLFSRRLRCPVSEIGRIRRGRGLALFRAGTRVLAPTRGFEHFKSL